MKANELMIGDWVSIRQLCSGILCQNDNVKIDAIRLLDFVENLDNPLIEPIPLTDEILKANGFEHIWGTYAWIRDSFHLHCQLHGEAPYSIEIAHKPHIPEIMYVHQLQHALRLCGLNDLADNFKV